MLAWTRVFFVKLKIDFHWKHLRLIAKMASANHLIDPGKYETQM